MLIFFMVSGTLATPLDKSLTLATSEKIEKSPPPNALVLLKDGGLSYRGEAIGEPRVTDLADDDGTVRLVPDRDASAQRLASLVQKLRLDGAKKVLIVTEEALP